MARALISNLARPEGNLTGFTDFEYSMGGKWLELLKDIAPKLMHIAFLFNPSAAPFAKQYIQSAQAGVKLAIAAHHIESAQQLLRLLESNKLRNR
jgi:putative ABC transport system substrate-binding protein